MTALDPKWLVVGDAVRFLAEYGSFVSLAYDSDNGFWSVEWITDGESV